MIPSRSRSLSAVLEAAERSGRLNVRTDELRLALPGVGAEALRQALHRQQRRGRLVRLSRGSDHWVIVPLQYAEAGAPPLEVWLDRYLRKTLGIEYYVALLSAAETYGASPYGVMVTQVMVAERRRSISVGRHKVVFLTRSRIGQMPTRWHRTPDGRFQVSTPELTALELVERAKRLGGIARVREVLRPLWRSCAAGGLVAALEALDDTPNAQRLGALLAADGHIALARRTARWLGGRPMRLVPLEAGAAADPAAGIDETFHVSLPAAAAGANA